MKIGAGRKHIPAELEANVLTCSKRRCCLCVGLHGDRSLKKGQIAHLDHDPLNNAPENLVFLCFDHHDEYDSTTKQSKNITINEVRNYRQALYQENGIDERSIYCIDAYFSQHPAALPPHGHEIPGLELFLKRLRAFVLADQIPGSGGWSLSQRQVFEYTTGRSATDIDQREGGIISTYMAVRSLEAAGLAMSTHELPGKAAAKYLMKRRTARGYFGRFVTSRSGEELKASLRHTALAALSLIILRGPPNIILDALQLLAAMHPEDLVDDSAPSISTAAVLLALETAVSPATQELFPHEYRQQFTAAINRLRGSLIMRLESEARSPNNPYSPLWEPYGHSPKMAFDSALTTIDFLTLLEQPPWEVMISALRHISCNQVADGLPYDPTCDLPDIGISTYFAAICCRWRMTEHLRSTPVGRDIMRIASQCLAFAIFRWNETRFMTRTYCDTVSNGLLFSPPTKPRQRAPPSRNI